MQSLQIPAIAGLALALTVAFPGLAAAKCKYTGFSFRLQNEVVNTSGTVDKMGCKMQYRAGGRTMFTESSIAEPPKHGTLKKTGSFAFSYYPKPGYTGPDIFALKVCGSNLQGPGCSTIKYSLTAE